MSPHGSESMTFSDVATVCIFESLLWFAATKLQILFHIAAYFLYLLLLLSAKTDYVFQISSFIRSFSSVVAMMGA
jgi:hypothetical protein